MILNNGKCCDACNKSKQLTFPVTVDLQDMSKMMLRINGPPKLPEGYKLSMHISKTGSESVRVFRPQTNQEGQTKRWSELIHKNPQENVFNQWKTLYLMTRGLYCRAQTSEAFSEGLYHGGGKGLFG